MVPIYAGKPMGKIETRDADRDIRDLQIWKVFITKVTDNGKNYGPHLIALFTSLYFGGHFDD